MYKMLPRPILSDPRAKSGFIILKKVSFAMAESAGTN